MTLAGSNISAPDTDVAFQMYSIIIPRYDVTCSTMKYNCLIVDEEEPYNS
jgi:hypothetical protein